MKSVHLVLLLVVLQAGTGVALYQWACTEPDGAGLRYVPSERDRDVVTATTNADVINAYNVGSLNEDCSGEVTAIEYCYRYDVTGTGEAVFRWTVLILENAGSSNFRITNSYTIESRPNSLSSDNCGAVSNGRKDCCDVDQINGFNLPDNFIYGVTGSSQGNTHSATLLGYFDTLSQYQVNTVHVSRAGHSLSVGSTIPSTPVILRGLRMLWFVIGSIATTTEPVTDEPSPSDPVTNTPPPTDPVTDTPSSTDPVTDAPSPSDPVTNTPPPTDPVTNAPSPTDPVTDMFSPTEPVTDDSTTSDMVSDNTSLTPTTTEASANFNLTTEPSASVTSDDNVVPLTGVGGQGTVIAIVVVVVLLTIILAVLVSIVVAFVVLKKRGEVFTVTHTNLNIGMSNQLYDLDASASNAYDYVDDNLPPSVKYKPYSETLVINGIGHQETVFNHSAGQNATSSDKPPIPDDIEHIYEDDFLFQGLDSAAPGAVDPVYEVPIASQDHEIPKLHSFSDAGYYVPTDAQRKNIKKEHQPMTYNKLEFFVEESIYWTPASTTSDLYRQLASKKCREIPRKELNILEELGSGEFGQVCKAVWSISGATKELAVKTLRAELPEEEKVRFLQEAAIMGQFSHPNVVKLYGVVTVGEPVMICLEFMANGDLRHYLCSIAPSKESTRELKLQFLRFSKQIASGMNYLANKSFVHRDLAARNVLLDKNLTCKIGDFGLARDLVYETYYTPSTKGGKVPIKWIAPEALLYKKYSTDSDVWSYGMVLFEIWSVGKKPFSQFSNNEMLQRINKGYNQPPPPGCPRAIYKLMVDCWNPVHSKRPSFADIGRSLSTSVDLLLQWVLEDDSISSQVGVLGAPLSEADSLYKDLQNVYADTQ